MKPPARAVVSNELKLPLPADRLVPHRPPLLLIDKLVEVTEDGAVVEAQMKETNPLVDETGRVDPLVFLEIMAQAYAAAKGYRDLLNGQIPGKGFLVGIRNFRVSDGARVGDTLHVSVRTVASIGGFSVAGTSVAKAGVTISSAELKLWVPEGGAEGEGP